MKTPTQTIKAMTKKVNIKKAILSFLLFGFLLFILSYATVKTRLISRGIELYINGVENGKIYQEGSLEINGNAKRAKHVLINGREINVNQEGDFNDFLVLSPGYNVITISAEDRFGKITKQIFDIVRNESENEEKFISLESQTKDSL